MPASGIAWRALMIRFSSTCWICAGLTRAWGRPLGLEVEPDPVPDRSLLDQQEHLLGQPDQVGRLAAVGAGPGQAEHATGDRRGPLRRLEDLLEGAAAVLGVGVAQAELGVVQDRRQRVVQLVADAAGQDAEAADPLQRDELTAEGLDLLLLAARRRRLV